MPQTLLVSGPAETELVAKPTAVKAKLADMALATQIIHAVPQLSVSGLYKIVDGWKEEQVSDLNSRLGSHVQTLAMVPKDIETQLQVRGLVGTGFPRQIPESDHGTLTIAIWSCRSRESFVRRKISSSRS
jgi:hypothetical protein